jgi:hypothetical protein
LGQLAAAGAVCLSTLVGIPGCWLEKGRVPSLAEMLRSHHGDARAVLASAVLPRFRFGQPSSADVARGITGQTTALYGDGLEVKIARLQEREDSAPAGVAALANKIRALSASRDKDSTKVALSKLTGPDGKVSWLVTIPGTIGASPIPGPNPAGMSTNLRGVAGDPNAVGIATVAAMQDAGVRKGEPVVFAGHSQGGIVSAQLAADPDFNRMFTVAGILTLGSPVSLMKPPKDQQWLSVEHSQDVVPAALPANERGANHTTVVRDLGVSAPPGGEGADNLLNAFHGTPVYARTGEMIDQSSASSLQAWRQAVAPVLNQNATVTTTEYLVERP